jgi:hypothetical protein
MFNSNGWMIVYYDMWPNVKYATWHLKMNLIQNVNIKLVGV